MLIDFEDKLDDGREIWFEADEFEGPDETVGYGGAVINFSARLLHVGFPVSLTESEEARLTNKAFEMWHEAVCYDSFDD